MSEITPSGKNVLKVRIFICGGFVFAVIFVYLIHLFNLQIVENLIWEGRAEAVSRRSNTIPSQRGKIWDRHGDEPLAVNMDSFALSIIPAETGMEPEAAAQSLGEVLGMSPQTILTNFPPVWKGNYKSFEIKGGIPFQTIIKIAEQVENFPGVFWSSKPYRWYSQAGSLSHILGYVGKITTEELQILYNQGYGTTSQLGKTGMEKQLDMVLRGKAGKRFSTVDAKERKLENERTRILPPENGLDVVLTVDRHIQELAEKALGPRKGSVVVLKPATGELLALVSYPSFDPNRFEKKGITSFASLSLNPDFPFLNRAIQSSYAPASTFKVLMTAAILGSKKFNPKERIFCSGSMTLGDREFFCHDRSGHGWLNMEEALAQSCNIYFGTVGVEHLGIDIISEYARAFGLGTPSGIELKTESSGIVPSKSWKEHTYNTPWTGGDTLNVSVGQGLISATPLQMANLTAAVVNDGTIYRPRLLKEIRDPATGMVIDRKEPEILRQIDLLSPQDYRTIRRAMRDVITQGTAQWSLYNKSVAVAGKTGTGEVGTEGSWHSWFISFGPYQGVPAEEQVVVVVMVEASEQWQWWASKAADIIYEGIFSQRTYEEVREEWVRRGVWWIGDAVPLPPPGEPAPLPENPQESPPLEEDSE